MKGRIVVCKEYGKPFEIEEYDVPTPESGAVLLRMTKAGTVAPTCTSGGVTR